MRARSRLKLVMWLLCGSILVVFPSTSGARKPPPAAKVETAEQEVERIAQDAVKAYKEARYDSAVELLNRAYAIRPLAPLLYNLGKAYEKQGDVVKAYETYKKYLDAVGDLPQEQRDPKLEGKAQEKMAALEPAYKAKKETDKTPTEIKPAGPSADELAARAAADRKIKDEEEARQREADGKKRRKALNLYLGAGVAGLGVVSFIVGVALYSAASGKQSDFSKSRDEDLKRSLQSSASSLGTGSTLMYVVGALLVVGSGWFWYSWMKKEPEATASLVPQLVPVVVPSSVGLTAGGVATWRF